MENKEQVSLPKQEIPDALPSLIEFIIANEVDGFDDVRKHNDLYNPSVSPPTFIPSASVSYHLFFLPVKKYQVMFFKKTNQF